MNPFIRSVLVLTFLLSAFTVPAKKNSTIRFGLCADIHVPTMHDSEFRVKTFIDAMVKQNPDFIIELGDFITPEPKYAKCLDIWNLYQGEKFHVIGNHEMDGGTTLVKALEYRNMKSSYYSFERQGFHFIVLDGNDKENPEVRGYQQFIGNEQVEWLKKDLSSASFPIIIFSHQGLSFHKGAEEGYGIRNYQQIQDILNQHNLKNPQKKVIICFNGHTHWDFAENIKGIWFVNITSMSYHWLGDNYVKIRYSDDVDKNFKWIKYTAPFKDPLYTIVEISTKGWVKIAGKKSEWVGLSPFELGYPEEMKKYMRPEISKRKLKF